MTQALLKVCTSNVRRAAIEQCGGTLKMAKDRGYVCPNKDIHLYPILTGFCNSGWHEGSKIDKPTCRFWITCPCDCHTTLSRMAALTQTERVMVDNSTWAPDRTGLVRVSLTEVTRAAVLAKPDVRVIPSLMPGLVPDRIVKEYAPTESGRAGRGQLDIWVGECIESWMQDRQGNCTPKLISEMIGTSYGVAKPSTGAIDAVFRRWEACGYAMIGRSPTRFISYTPAGLRDGLEVLRARMRRG